MLITQESFYLMANLPQFDHFEHRHNVLKDRLFYDQFKYCISFTLAEVSVLKNPISHYNIDLQMDKRLDWQRLMGNSFTPRITWYTRDKIHELVEVMIKFNPEEYKFNTSYQKIWIYTNSQLFVTKLAELEFVEGIQVSEAIINRPRNTVKLKNSTHTHRSYFRFATPTEESRARIIKFLKLHQEDITPSPALVTWSDCVFSYPIRDHYFVDYTSESWLLMLNLLHPGLIRKTLTIIPA